LTQIPEFHEDEFYFRMRTDELFALEDGTPTTSREFELQYIMHHEISASALLQVLGVTDLIEITEYYQKFDFHLVTRSVGGSLTTTWDDDNDTQPLTPNTISSVSTRGVYQAIALPDGRMATERHDGEPSPVADITTTQWDDFGIQVFRFGGDLTLIGEGGALTDIPEFHEDDFHFPLQTNARHVGAERISSGRDFELQYIMRHEISDSALCRLLGIEPCD